MKIKYLAIALLPVLFTGCASTGGYPEPKGAVATISESRNSSGLLAGGSNQITEIDGKDVGLMANLFAGSYKLTPGYHKVTVFNKYTLGMASGWWSTIATVGTNFRAGGKYTVVSSQDKDVVKMWIEENNQKVSSVVTSKGTPSPWISGF